MLYMKAQAAAAASTLSVAKSYPMSEVRNSGPECQAATAQERLGGATPRPSEVRGGREETPSVRGQGRPREATLSLRPGAVTLRSHPKPRPGPAAGRSNPRSGG